MGAMALITGCTAGIGFQVARMLFDFGCGSMHRLSNDDKFGIFGHRKSF